MFRRRWLMDLRLYIFEGRQRFEGDMDLRVCACFSACGHMDLLLCMFERWRRYGITFLHIAAPAVIWTYVYAYARAAGELWNADVAVA